MLRSSRSGSAWPLTQVSDGAISSRALDCCGIQPQVSDRVISHRALDRCGIPPQVSDRVISYRALDCCGIPPQVSDRVISHRALDRCGIPPQVSDRVISHRALDRCGGWPRSLAVGDRGAMDASARKRLLLENPAGSSQHPTQKPGRNQCFSGKGPSRNGRPTRDVETGRGSGLLIAGPSPFQPPRRAGGPGPSQLGTGERWVLQPEKDYSSKTPHGPVSILPKKPGRNQCFSGKAPSGNGRPTRDVETGRGSGLLIAGPSPFQPPRQGRGGLPAMRRLRPFAYTRGFSGVLPGRSGRLGEEN